MNELVKVDMSEYGLTETKAQEVKQVFDAVLATAEHLEAEYNRVCALEVSPEACAEAKSLRLKYVKVRTGIAKAHQEQKAFYLSGGRAVDGLKNAYTHAVQGNEQKLKEIEAYYERIEEARLAKLNDERATALDPYVDDDAHARVLSGMEEDVFAALLFMAKTKHDERIAAEQKVEADRIAKEKADAEERQRIAEENERLKEEAAERERIEAARVEAELAANYERDKAEAERLDAEEAERKRIEAEREKERKEAADKLAAERAERERIEADAKAKEDAKAKRAAEDAARAKDTEHRRAVNNEVAAALQGQGLSLDQAKTVIAAIFMGLVPNVTITY